MLIIRLLSVSIIYALTSCSSPNKLAHRNAINLDVPGKENAANKILFLTFNIRLVDSATDTHSFSLVNSVLAPGKLHQNSFRSDGPLEPYYLYCEITGDDKKEATLIKVQNPLLRVIEYSPEPGVLEKKLFVNKSGEIYLRFQFTKASKYLTIYKLQADLRTLKKIYHAQM